MLHDLKDVNVNQQAFFDPHTNVPNNHDLVLPQYVIFFNMLGYCAAAIHALMGISFVSLHAFNTE
jgi:hypothetical protein